LGEGVGGKPKASFADGPFGSAGSGASNKVLHLPPFHFALFGVAAVSCPTSLRRLSPWFLLLAGAAAAWLSFESVKEGRATKPRSGEAERAKARAAERSIELFVGSASRLPVEEAARLFERETGVGVVSRFGGSGRMLSEMKLAGRGDVYLPGSSDYMELAKESGLVVAESERIVAYLVPALVVAKGNPLGILRLEDLARPGLRVAIARPDAVCVGLYAAEILERAGISGQVRPNIVTHAESCEKLAQVVALGLADAAIGWSVMQYWDDERLEAVALAPAQVSRIGYIPVAVSVFSRKPALARRFIAFLTSPAGRSIFSKWHYMVAEEEARRFAGAQAPVGGRWELPPAWER